MAAGLLPQPAEEEGGTDAVQGQAWSVGEGGEKEGLFAECGAGGEQALKLARGGEQIDAAQGGEDALFVDAGFASVFDELQVLAWSGAFEAEEHGLSESTIPSATFIDRKDAFYHPA